DVKLLGYVTPNPAIQSNRCYTCLATGLGIRGAQELDTDEDIEVSSVSPQEISGLIASGAISHALVVSAFAFFFGLALPNSAIEAALSSRFIEVPHES
ncbi:MAG: hypothetical protein KAI47_22415, partial [Deltaproteobacteria bacterium]|nr:hypothetical protein [Deltaproteobacteria bacterium]